MCQFQIANNERRANHEDLMRGCLFVLSGLILFLNVALAAEKPFYQGKTITFFINFSAGGPTDIEGRIVAGIFPSIYPEIRPSLCKTCPVAVESPGINFLGEVAKPDALTLGYFTGPYNHQMMKSTTLRVDLMKVPFISAVQGVTVCYIRSDVPPGIKKPTDLAKAERFRAGGLSFDSNKDLRFRLAFDILGLKYDYVTGYNSSNDARLAVQRNEIQYHDENIPGYRGVVEPQMVKTGMVTPLYYHDVIRPDGNMVKSPDYPELSSFTEVYTQIHGKAPTGIKYEALKAANMASQNLNRVALLPPGSPPEAIATMRQAFASLAKDEEFIADAKKVMRFQPRFETGEDGEKLRDKVLNRSRRGS